MLRRCAQTAASKKSFNNHCAHNLDACANPLRVRSEAMRPEVRRLLLTVLHPRRAIVSPHKPAKLRADFEAYCLTAGGAQSSVTTAALFSIAYQVLMT